MLLSKFTSNPTTATKSSAIVDSWKCSANDAIELDLVRLTAKPRLSPFHPTFTYPVFGQSETIVGYRGLKVQLKYSASSLRCLLKVNYTEKAKQNQLPEGLQPDDIVRLLVRNSDGTKFEGDNINDAWLKHDYMTNEDEFLKRCEEDERTFRPLGEKIHEFTQGDEVDENGEPIVFELYKCTFTTPGFVDYHRRLQTFLLWFIEGSRYIEEEDLRWNVYLLFEKRKTQTGPLYSIAGYTTVYPYMHLQPTAVTLEKKYGKKPLFEGDKRHEKFVHELALRMRVSQFLIFPPWQGRGIGTTLYQYLYTRFLADSEVAELTVEDPNPSFQIMRDVTDIKYLTSQNAFNAEEVSLSGYPSQTVVDFRKRWKLDEHQVTRLFELYLMKDLKPSPSDLRKYRLCVKRRIFRENAEVMAEMDNPERKKVLEEVYQEDQEEYKPVVEKLQNA